MFFGMDHSDERNFSSRPGQSGMLAKIGDNSKEKPAGGTVDSTVPLGGINRLRCVFKAWS
jgi:hypothetical protein